MLNIRESKPSSILFALLLGAAPFSILYWGVGRVWPLVGIDWKETYYPAVQALIRALGWG